MDLRTSERQTTFEHWIFHTLRSTDRGVRLKKMGQLEFANLIGTKITDDSTLETMNLKKLRRVYTLEALASPMLD